MIRWLLYRIFEWWLRRRRSIFPFWDGRRCRWVDPVIVARRLLSLDYFDANDTPKMALAGHEDALADCARAAAESFDIPQFTDKDGRPQGLTEAELIRLLDRFMQWMHVQKKSTRSMPISPPPTESLSSADVPDARGSDSGSGQTATDKHYDAQPEWLKQYTSPSLDK